ncbi:MAG: nucleotidyltransferase domain-containing protein [Halapricum sp.]
MRFVGQRGETPPEIDSDALRTALADYPLSLVVLFGSYATGSVHPLSDLDVAVRFEDTVPRARQLRLLDEVTAAIQRAAGIEAVDLVDLERVSPTVGYEALARGTLLIGDRAEATALETRLLHRTLDFAPVKREWDAALSRRIMEGEFGRP